MRVTPVPIPNTMVKTQAADGTSLETVRESRWPPPFNRRAFEHYAWRLSSLYIYTPSLMGMKACALLHACGISSSFSTYQESLSI